MRDAPVDLGGAVLDLAAAELRRDEVAIALTPLEVRVLRHLHAAAGRTVTRQALGAAAWGTPPEGRAVDHVIARLRARIEPDPAHPRFLLTVRGQGFRFGPAAPPEPAPASSSATAPPARAGVALPAGLLDLAGGRMVRATGEVALTRTERALLAYLLERPGQVVSRAELLTAVWGWKPGLDSRTVEKAAERLRRKLELHPAAPAVLRTERGSGLRLVVPTGNAADAAGPLIGRRALLDSVAAALDAGRLVTLTGPGGIGKTRVARAHAATSRAACAHAGGCWFVDASSATGPDGLLASMGAALGLRVERADALPPALAARGRHLLVLDNCEQLGPLAAEAVGRWLDGAPELRILATSRAPLGVPGEVLVTVPPLPVAEAVQLLTARGAATGPGVEALARRLEGHPLALELAAARLQLLSSEELTERLDRSLDALGARPGGGRHASLPATLGWSWDLLAPRDAAALARAAALAGPFDRAAFAAIACPDATEDASLATLARLLDASLLEAVPETGPRRFRLPVLLRAFAVERAAAAVAEAQATHAAWFAARAAEAERGLVGPDPAPAHRFLRSALADLLAAHAWAASHAPDEAAHIASALARSAIPRAHAAALLERALAAGASGDARAGATEHLGTLRTQAGRSSEARALFEALWEDPAAPPARRAVALSWLAQLDQREGALDRCRERFREARRLVRSSGDDRAASQIFHHAAVLLGPTSAADETAEWFGMAVDAAERAGAARSLVSTLRDRARWLHDREAFDAALADLDRAWTTARAAEDPELVLELGGERAWVQLDRGRPEEAERGVAAVIAAARTHQPAAVLAFWLIRLGYVRLESGTATAACTAFGEAVEVADRAGLRPTAAVGRIGAALAHLVAGDVEAARDASARAAEALRTLQRPLQLELAALVHATALAEAGDPATADRHVRALAAGVTAGGDRTSAEMLDIVRAAVDQAATGVPGPVIAPTAYRATGPRAVVRAYLAARERLRARRAAT